MKKYTTIYWTDLPENLKQKFSEVYDAFFRNYGYVHFDLVDENEVTQEELDRDEYLQFDVDLSNWLKDNGLYGCENEVLILINL